MDTQLLFLDPKLKGCSVEVQTKSLLVSTQTPLANSNPRQDSGCQVIQPGFDTGNLVEVDVQPNTLPNLSNSA